MIIRLSQQMSKKVKLPGLPPHEAAANPLCDWAMHLFRFNRLQYLLATNTTSLFSVVIPGRGIADGVILLSRLFPALHELHCHAGLEEAFERFIAPKVAHVVWSKANNRAVTGSMNQLIYEAQWLLEDSELKASGLSPAELSQRLNLSLFSLLKYQRPLEAHHQLTEIVTRSSL